MMRPSFSPENCVRCAAFAVSLALLTFNGDVAMAQAACPGPGPQRLTPSKVRYTFNLTPGQGCYQPFLPATVSASSSNRTNPNCGTLTTEPNAQGFFYEAALNPRERPCTDSFSFVTTANDGSIAEYDFVIVVQ